MSYPTAIGFPALPSAEAMVRRVRKPIAGDVGVAGLTRDLAAGDEAAFEEFHQRYFQRLFRFLLVLTRGDEVEAGEALQETLCRVARYSRRFDDEEVFWCWLTVLARSAVRDGGRKRRRYWNLLQQYAQGWLPVQAGPPPAEEERLHHLLSECLHDLEPADRALIEGKYLGRASVRELAETEGLTEKACESRLLRLRRHLRERLLEKLKADSP